MNTERLHQSIQRIYPLTAILCFALGFTVTFDTYALSLSVAMYNLFLSLFIFGFCLILTRRLHIATILANALVFFLYYVDQFVYATRLTHIRLSDFGLIGQAAGVASRYSIVWNDELTRKLLVLIALSAMVLLMYRRYKLDYGKARVAVIGVALIGAVGLTVALGLIPSDTEDFDYNSKTEQRGILYSWYCQYREGSLKEPEGYSYDAAQEILSQYSEQSATDDVRIIAIMNESLADYSLLGEPRFDDPLPVIHSLGKSSFEGKLAVSVFGGGTADTEFEFLTGNSKAFLPEGSTPYLQYVNHSMESIAKDTTANRAIAIHPYYSEEWNRTQVYKYLGFDDFVSGVDFGSAVELSGGEATARPDDNLLSFGEGPLYVRGLISDKTCYERILEERCSFTFAVTMQNHGSYSYKGNDFTNKTYVTEEDRQVANGARNINAITVGMNAGSVEDEVYEVNQYLTCANLSDEAFRDLINKLKDDDQKTIVLMFGDHQPGLLIAERYVNCDDADSRDIDYVVPYILWANYDITFEAPKYISANYLSAVLKKNAGMALTQWDQFRLDTMRDYPVITTQYVMDAAGNYVDKDVLHDYELVQYMRMFE